MVVDVISHYTHRCKSHDMSSFSLILKHQTGPWFVRKNNLLSYFSKNLNIFLLTNSLLHEHRMCNFGLRIMYSMS